ncbi:hypothetical protein DOTSEDRAFT_148511 [Dothistroma septosporum NZE10]|uniref:Uncharacterized protein n=1 Tax=Dothistroma septosporum (strain NZE10 / CBS 128990) TaxID=675120 RepID=N1PVB9_DOTSN|nr:hypothetical protein DOTSEDRAFT_148511 [Dothistroma septosporum NZE10]
MFDSNFTFDPAPRSPSLDSTSNTISTRTASRSVSPCSPTTAFPPPRFSVTDLAASFATSRLRPDSQICYDSCDSYANTDDDAGWAVPVDEDEEYPEISRSRTLPQRPHSPSRRMHRQMQTRMLCNMSHAKDISALVSQMVDSNDQCTILSRSISPTTEDDEGYNSSSDPLVATESRRSSMATTKARLKYTYRRSSDLKTVGAYVSKTTGFRKDKKHRRVRSAESER